MLRNRVLSLEEREGSIECVRIAKDERKINSYLATRKEMKGTNSWILGSHDRSFSITART
jgi:hypothetical protein